MVVFERAYKMPHLVILYTGNLEAVTDMTALCRAMADAMGVVFVPWDEYPSAFLAQHDLDVIVVAVSILSFEATVQQLAPHLRAHVNVSPQRAPLVVDVLSVKEHARKVLLQYLPPECDIMCSHPMFGPDSGKNGWYGLNFVYEKTRIDRVLLPTDDGKDAAMEVPSPNPFTNDDDDTVKTGHVEGMDRMERFLSIWEEEGCRMVPLSCTAHDAHAANSQFVTHLVGRVLGSQGLQPTPIDTSGFQSVLKLVGSTTADSFDLFYGLYKYNKNSLATIRQLQTAMNDVVGNLQTKEQGELEKKWREQDRKQPLPDNTVSQSK